MDPTTQCSALGPSERAKWVDLQGRSDRELRQRIDTLHDAIRAQAGAILVIKWNPTRSNSVHWASVLYQVPPGSPGT